MTATVQKLLPIRAELRRPVVDLAAARSILELHEDEIKDLVDLLVLPAWNIARFPSAERREIRILAVACRNQAEGKAKPEYDVDDIIRRVYGPTRLLLKSTWVARSWNCDAGHVGNLIKDKTLTSVQPLAQGIVADVTWLSAVAFLNARRIK